MKISWWLNYLARFENKGLTPTLRVDFSTRISSATPAEAYAPDGTQMVRLADHACDPSPFAPFTRCNVSGIVINSGIRINSSRPMTVRKTYAGPT